jgi:adenosylcobinamide-GDP ribazoletransferase
MSRELRIFFTALMFYSRLPVPKGIDHSETLLAAATKYFPLVGWIVGGISAALFWLCHQVLPIEVSVIGSMICSVAVTGALHEDGLADACDGFGGGWTRQKILDIMKDSRTGSFGVVGIVLTLLLKTALLIHIPVAWLPFSFIAAHALSRWCSTLMIAFGTYARPDESSKIKPVARKMRPGQVMVASVFGVLPLVLFQTGLIIGILPFLWLITFLLYRYFKKWIGGYTGDCLGAVQQITELAFYLGLLIVWKYTS